MNEDTEIIDTLIHLDENDPDYEEKLRVITEIVLGQSQE